jgi:hypothetical protein
MLREVREGEADATGCFNGGHGGGSHEEEELTRATVKELALERDRIFWCLPGLKRCDVDEGHLLALSHLADSANRLEVNIDGLHERKQVGHFGANASSDNLDKGRTCLNDATAHVNDEVEWEGLRKQVGAQADVILLVGLGYLF